MSDGRILQLLLLLGALILALRALSAQRIDQRGILQALALWAIIGVTIVIAILMYQR